MFLRVAALVLMLLGAAGCDRGPSPEEKAARAELRLALRERAYEKAIELARRLLQSAPQDDGLWARLVRARIGARDLAGARQSLTDWQRSVPKPSPKLDELAGDIAMKENDPARAVQSWTKAASAEPRNKRVLMKLTRGHRAEGQWPQADAALTKLLEIAEDATVRMERALCRRRLHRWTEALEDSRRAQELAPDDPDVRRGARLFDRLGKFLAEIRELDARLAVAPDDDQTLTDRALLFLRSQDAELALADAQLAAQKAPWAVRPVLFQALALIELGRADECDQLAVDNRIRLSALSSEFLETVSRIDAEISVERNNPELYIARAWQLNEIGQPRLALQDAEVALQHDTNSAAAHAERSYALTKLGRVDEAFEQIKRATELDTSLAAAWQYRGELELARGDFAAAIGSLSHALTITPSYAALQKREHAYRQLGHIEKADEDLHALQALSVP